MNFTRRHAIRNMAGAAFCFSAHSLFGTPKNSALTDSDSPVNCNYAPPGEYIKDHTLVFHDGWWHLFSISGTQGYYHGYNGNEETFSWSVSKNLVEWEFRGHVMHPSQREGTFDQHEVWAPFCLKANDQFYMFYTGIIHPYRPMDNPVDFKNGEVRYFDNTFNDRVIDMGCACEIIEHNGKWYRSGTFGEVDHWRLGFTEIEWVKDGAFRIVKPSDIN